MSPPAGPRPSPGATSPPAGQVARRLEVVRERVAAAAVRAGRDPASVRLVVVTKGVPVEVAAEAFRAGALDLGESRAQELAAKAAHLPGAAWHFIGRIQRNKVRALAGVVRWWHSVDRLEVGRLIGQASPGAPVLVEVNVAGDPAKAGCRPEDAPRIVEGLRELALDVRGLMTLPPAGEPPRPTFRSLAHLASGLGLGELSMGMSGDFEEAIEEGATIVRVGQAVFAGSGYRAGPTPANRLSTEDL